MERNRLVALVISVGIVCGALGLSAGMSLAGSSHGLPGGAHGPSPSRWHGVPVPADALDVQEVEKPANPNDHPSLTFALRHVQLLAHDSYVNMLVDDGFEKAGGFSPFEYWAKGNEQFAIMFQQALDGIQTYITVYDIGPVTQPTPTTQC